MKKNANNIFYLYKTPINNISMAKALDTIKKFLSAQGCRKVFFVNADCINKIHHDPEYKEILKSGDLVLPDGIGIRIAGWVCNNHIRENVNGTDMFPLLLEILNKKKSRLFLLGAKPGVSTILAEKIQQQFPDIIITGEQHGFYKPEAEAQIIQKIKNSRTELLLVALGAPGQEKWIERNLRECQVKVAIGVGGLFDFYAGINKRAPLWIRRIGFEWLYRVYQEPKRLWKRYFIGNFIFLFRLLVHKIKKAG